ncbi:hypothetical protein HanIR_Chr05g0222021 [Helianthus annuus]|nr:hypothetical protein HanIR_Chr05g0222021 [Helianthus annuus]
MWSIKDERLVTATRVSICVIEEGHKNMGKHSKSIILEGDAAKKTHWKMVIEGFCFSLPDSSLHQCYSPDSTC